MSDDMAEALRDECRAIGCDLTCRKCPPRDAANRIAALEAEVARLKLFIASDVSRAVGLMNILLPGPLSHDDTHEAYLSRMSALFTAEAEKLDAGVSAALHTPPEGETP